MRDMCFQPNDPDSIERHPKIDGSNTHNLLAEWQLNPNTNFIHLAYHSVKPSEKANYIALATLVVIMMTLFTVSERI